MRVRGRRAQYAIRARRAPCRSGVRRGGGGSAGREPSPARGARERVGEAPGSHAGRKRRRNEDAWVCHPPLFAVADGMGGARGGEIASRVAATALGEPVDGSGESRVVALIQEANRQVYERAQRGLGHVGNGDDDHPRSIRGRDRLDRARRRLPRVPDSRPEGRAADRGSLPRRRARPYRPALAGGGRGAPAALGDHEGAGNRPRGRRRRVLHSGEARRPVPHLLGRTDRDGRRRDDPRRRRALSATTSTPPRRSSSRPQTATAARTTSPSSSSRSSSRQRRRQARRSRCPRSARSLPRSPTRTR